MKRIEELFDTTEKPSTKWTGYFDVYERHLSKFVGKAPKILEIGVLGGGSIELWLKYFGEGTQVIGVDIDPRCLQYKYNGNAQVIMGNQGDPAFWDEFLDKNTDFDIIIDDGSHDQMDVMNSFSILFQHLKDDGVYIIEDLHTAYNNQFHGGITSPLNFISIASRFVHDVNLSWITEPYTPVTQNLKSISFYDSMLVLEKEPTYKKEPCYTGVNKVTE